MGLDEAASNIEPALPLAEILLGSTLDRSRPGAGGATGRDRARKSPDPELGTASARVRRGFLEILLRPGYRVALGRRISIVSFGLGTVTCISVWPPIAWLAITLTAPLGN